MFRTARIPFALLALASCDLETRTAEAPVDVFLYASGAPASMPDAGGADLSGVLPPAGEPPAPATDVVPSPPPGTATPQAGCVGPVAPLDLDFGAQVVGKPAELAVAIAACDGPLDVTGVDLRPGWSAAFSLDLSGLPSVPSAAQPIHLGTGEKEEFSVSYAPTVETGTDENGKPIPDLGWVLVRTGAGTKYVGLRGEAVEQGCPTAVIVVQEGEEVIPQTVLHLFGDQSFAQLGAIKKWEWSVTQPVGSQSVFIPSSTFPNPTFEANVAGTYTFTLTVHDESGTPSCVPAEQQVVVIPDEAIHVELLWVTPNDPDETDEGPEAGSDVDFHFTHPYATGPDLDGDGKPDGWFDQPFDCFWFNHHPNWGSFDPAIDDDPGLDRDDTDGAGPENINLNIPENKTYRVGVNYWSDHGYGPVYATVRVYVYATLVFELKDVLLVNHDMWEVATIEWPSGKVAAITGKAPGGYKIIPNYENPFFFQP